MKLNTERLAKIVTGEIIPTHRAPYRTLEEAVERALWRSGLPQNQCVSYAVISEADEFRVGREYSVIKYSRWVEDDVDLEDFFLEAIVTDGQFEIVL